MMSHRDGNYEVPKFFKIATAFSLVHLIEQTSATRKESAPR